MFVETNYSVGVSPTKSSPSMLSLWLFWSVVGGAYVAIGFASHILLFGGSVPPAFGGISHWWDIAAPSIIVLGLMAGFELLNFIDRKVSGNFHVDLLTVVLILCGFVVPIVGTVKYGILGATLSVLCTFVLFAISFLPKLLVLVMRRLLGR